MPMILIVHGAWYAYISCTIPFVHLIAQTMHSTYSPIPIHPEENC